MRHFPIIYLLLLLFYLFFLGGGGRGSKLSIMIATLKKNSMEQPPHPPIPLENKNELRKSHNMPFIWGRWGVNEKFLSILSKTALHQVENGKGCSSWGPLIRLLWY